MYNWLFFKIYDFYKHKKNHDPIFNTSLLVFFTQVVHISVLLLILSKIMNFEMPKFSTDNSTNRLLFFPIGIIWLILVQIYYKKKVQNLGKTKGNEPISLYQLLILLIAIILIPLYLGIKLSGGEIWK